jgi:hypothetical protein
MDKESDSINSMGHSVGLVQVAIIGEQRCRAEVNLPEAEVLRKVEFRLLRRLNVPPDQEATNRIGWCIGEDILIAGDVYHVKVGSHCRIVNGVGKQPIGKQAVPGSSGTL